MRPPGAAHVVKKNAIEGATRPGDGASESSLQLI